MPKKHLTQQQKDLERRLAEIVYGQTPANISVSKCRKFSRDVAAALRETVELRLQWFLSENTSRKEDP